MLIKFTRILKAIRPAKGRAFPSVPPCVHRPLRSMQRDMHAVSGWTATDCSRKDEEAIILHLK